MVMSSGTGTPGVQPPEEGCTSQPTYPYYSGISSRGELEEHVVVFAQAVSLGQNASHARINACKGHSVPTHILWTGNEHKLKCPTCMSPLDYISIHPSHSNLTPYSIRCKPAATAAISLLASVAVVEYP